jgi:hypothetical protein
MKKIIPALEKQNPLPQDKPATYTNDGKTKKVSSTGNRTDRGVAKIKSDTDSPQKIREKMEYDIKKPEMDPGMTKR